LFIIIIYAYIYYYYLFLIFETSARGTNKPYVDTTRDQTGGKGPEIINGAVQKEQQKGPRLLHGGNARLHRLVRGKERKKERDIWRIYKIIKIYMYVCMCMYVCMKKREEKYINK
jgi:hypothetical protein